MRSRRRQRRLDIQPRELADDEELVAYRVVLTDDRDHADFVRSFTSRQALGLPPRTWTQEGPNPELAAGLSAYRSREAAAVTARKAAERGRGFGDFVAELRLQPAQGLRIAEWGPPGHLTIWGDPLTLAGYTVDILPTTTHQGGPGP